MSVDVAAERFGVRAARQAAAEGRREEWMLASLARWGDDKRKVAG